MPQLNGKEVGPIGFGLMGMTWRKTPPPVSQSLQTLSAALSHNMTFWNGGEFYGTPTFNSMTILKEYFTQHPEDADKVVLSIKGTFDHKTFDVTAAGVRRSIDSVLSQLGGTKKLDLFECARRDPKVPMAETFGAMQEYIDKGLLGGICLSEVSAATIHEAVKHAKIAGVEVELSLFTPDVLTNGVAAACAQYDIPLIAYSPLGRGILTGQFKSLDDIPADHPLRDYPRYSAENFEHNVQLFHHVNALAERKGCTTAQLAISWTVALSRRPGMPSTIIPIPGATTVERVAENAVLVELTDAEMDEIDAILAKFEAKGARYAAYVPINT